MYYIYNNKFIAKETKTKIFLGTFNYKKKSIYKII